MLLMAPAHLLFPAAAVLAQEGDGRITITAEDILEMRAVRMADVLNQVPGLKAGDSSVAIHGAVPCPVTSRSWDGRTGAGSCISQRFFP